MIESKVPKYYWPEAVATTTYLMNRLPTKILHMKTPISTLAQYTNIPPVLTLPPRVFGSTVYVHLPKVSRTKLDPCAVKCVFVGYGIHTKGYRCFDPQSGHMYTTMDCDFLEIDYYFHNQPSDQGESSRNDPLSWLHSPILPKTVPTEQVGEITGSVSDNMEQSITPYHVESSPTNILEVNDFTLEAPLDISAREMTNLTAQEVCSSTTKQSGSATKEV